MRGPVEDPAWPAQQEDECVIVLDALDGRVWKGEENGES